MNRTAQQATGGASEWARLYARTEAATFVTGLLLGVIGYGPTLAVCGSSSIAAMWIGIGIALVGGWAGSLPAFAALGRAPTIFMSGFLGGLGARAVVTIAPALVLKLSGYSPIQPLLVWVGIAQFVILSVDTLGLVHAARRIDRAKVAA